MSTRNLAMEPSTDISELYAAHRLEDEGAVRTWLSETGSLYSAVAAGGEAWVVWQWLMVSDSEVAAMPWGTLCFSDIDAAITTGC